MIAAVIVTRVCAVCLTAIVRTAEDLIWKRDISHARRAIRRLPVWWLFGRRQPIWIGTLGRARRLCR